MVLNEESEFADSCKMSAAPLQNHHMRSRSVLDPFSASQTSSDNDEPIANHDEALMTSNELLPPLDSNQTLTKKESKS